MKIDYAGQVFELDLENITLKQAMAVQGYAGMSIMKLFDQLKDVEEDTPELFKALGALYWLMQNQAGNVFPIAEVDFPLAPFAEAFFRAMLAEEPATRELGPEGEPVPTVPSPASSPSLPVPQSLETILSPGTGVSAPFTAS